MLKDCNWHYTYIACFFLRLLHFLDTTVGVLGTSISEQFVGQYWYHVFFLQDHMLMSRRSMYLPHMLQSHNHLNIGV